MRLLECSKTAEVCDARVVLLDLVGGAENGDDGREGGGHELALYDVPGLLAGESVRPHGDCPRHVPGALPLRPRGAAARHGHGVSPRWTARWFR